MVFIHVGRLIVVILQQIKEMKESSWWECVGMPPGQMLSVKAAAADRPSWVQVQLQGLVGPDAT